MGEEGDSLNKLPRDYGKSRRHLRHRHILYRSVSQKEGLRLMEVNRFCM